MSTIENELDVGMPDRPEPPPAENVGKNHRRFILLGALTFSGVAWIFGLYLYSFIFGPTDVLDRGDYLRTEVNFNLIPALPDNLAEAYDLLREEQLANIEDMGMSASMGMAIIPIDDAIDFLLENGGYPVGENVVVPPAEEMEDTGEPALEEATEAPAADEMVPMEEATPDADEDVPASSGFQEIEATSGEVTPEAESGD